MPSHQSPFFLYEYIILDFGAFVKSYFTFLAPRRSGVVYTVSLSLSFSLYKDIIQKF
jgi:hypothetical protein